MPLEKLENGGWQHPSRLPLGAGWRGLCTAPGHEGVLPELAVLESSCNLGYASACTWAPIDRNVDAVRFAVNAPPEQGKRRDKAPTEMPRVLSLRYVCERKHRPVEHGDLQFDLAAAAWVGLHPDARIQKMAECFLESYLKKKPEKTDSSIRAATKPEGIIESSEARKPNHDRP